MDIDSRLYVEIHPFDGPRSPHPHPIDDGHFDPEFVYKVLGMYNPSETSECYFVLANTERQIWFIPQRHLLAYRLINSEEFFLPKADVDAPTHASPATVATVATAAGPDMTRATRGIG
jgi:hypothetical protein